jgi:predicted molibdopterin-dependent oxidoreductase YjgC
VAGLAATLGNGAMSNSIPEIEDAQCVFIFGYNAADSHPIIARRIVAAKEKGAKIVVVDPRFTESARISDLWLPIRNGTNMALVNAFGHVLIEEGLYNKDYVNNFTEGFETYRENVAKYTPAYAEGITGISEKQIREAMRMYAAAPNAFILYGMGVTHYGQAVDVVKGLSGLALLTGNFLRPRRPPQRLSRISEGDRCCGAGQVREGLGCAGASGRAWMHNHRSSTSRARRQAEGVLHLRGGSGTNGSEREQRARSAGQDGVRDCAGYLHEQNSSVRRCYLPGHSLG